MNLQNARYNNKDGSELLIFVYFCSSFEMSSFDSEKGHVFSNSQLIAVHSEKYSVVISYNNVIIHTCKNCDLMCQR
jgi:hypothetical protein